MRFIPTKIHGAMDYIMAVVLIASPWIFGFATGGPAMWVPIILGAGVVAYSLLTAYEAGAVPMLSMKAHLALDAVGGILLAVSPWLFQFAEIVWIPHVVLGIAEIGAALMTQTQPGHIPHGGGRRRVPGA